MRKLSLFITLLFCISTIFAQKNKNATAELPGFGKVDKADLQMKSCDFDDKAEVMVLLDDGQLDFIFDKGIELNRRIRIKILSNKGLESANIHLPYYSDRNSQEITSLDAQTYNLDENGNMVVTKVEKKLIYEKKINKKFSEKVFTFPEVKVGSIIEYKYKHTGIGLIDWYFQKSIPVKYSHFVMDFPEEVEVTTIPSCS